MNASARVRVTREVPTGLTKIKADVIYIDDIHVHLTLHFRYTGGFRPYLLDIKLDACDLMTKATFLMENPAVKKIASGMKEAFPAIFTGCPYKVSFLRFSRYLFTMKEKKTLQGHVESTWIDNNATYSENLPPIIPKGRHKYLFRFYTSKNETILFYENQMDFVPRKDFRAMGNSLVYVIVLLLYFKITCF